MFFVKSSPDRAYIFQRNIEHYEYNNNNNFITEVHDGIICISNVSLNCNYYYSIYKDLLFNINESQSNISI